jgi:Arc/MetJ-type ribon-helix-helix transcriptional regulator
VKQLRVNISDEVMQKLDDLVNAGTDDRSHFVRLALNEYLNRIDRIETAALHQTTLDTGVSSNEFCASCGAAVKLNAAFHKDGCIVAREVAAPIVQEVTPDDDADFLLAMQMVEELRSKEKRELEAKAKLDALSEDLLSMENMQL